MRMDLPPPPAAATNLWILQLRGAALSPSLHF